MIQLLSPCTIGSMLVMPHPPHLVRRRRATGPSASSSWCGRPASLPRLKVTIVDRRCCATSTSCLTSCVPTVSTCWRMILACFDPGPFALGNTTRSTGWTVVRHEPAVSLTFRSTCRSTDRKGSPGTAGERTSRDGRQMNRDVERVVGPEPRFAQGLAF